VREAPPLRSLLFVPGNKERWFAGAAASGADALVLDLEDAVPRGERETARALVRAALADLESSDVDVFVRVNGFEEPDALWADLQAVTVPGLAGVMLPKVTGPRDVVLVDGALSLLEATAGLAAGSARILPLLETANAIRTAYEIGIASPRVAYLGGITAPGGDVARAIGFEFTAAGAETLGLRSQALIDARAAGIEFPVTGLWTDVGDLDGLRAFCVQNRQLGYAGMLAIHPSHVPVINDVFMPRPEEVAELRELVAALEAAEAAGTTAIRFRGSMIDTAHVRNARHRLELAERLGA
jgi:citrate lyase subunit beta/citryl-CoA lyase